LVTVQARDPSQAEQIQSCPYNPGVPRKLSKPRPAQGARLVALRKAAALSQAELARLIGEPQQNVALWEQSNKPPRSDAIPKLARALSVQVEDLFTDKATSPRRSGPVGKVRKLFDEVSCLPRRQQDKIVEFLAPIVEEFKRKAG
jgi:transcriptional regulator with XRE-family HTH domain